MKSEVLVEVGILGVVGYFVYKWLSSPSTLPGAAVNAVSSGIANAIVGVSNWVYGSSNIQPSGNVILPDGTKVPLSQLGVTWDDANNVASFVYQGFGYIIPPNPSGGPAYDQNGDYHAQ